MEVFHDLLHQSDPFPRPFPVGEVTEGPRIAGESWAAPSWCQQEPLGEHREKQMEHIYRHWNTLKSLMDEIG